MIGRPRARRRRLPQPAEPARPGAADAAAARVPRALRRARRDRARRAVPALRREPRRAGRPTGARRSGSCTATTGSTTCCSTDDGCTCRRLADGQLGTGDARRLLLPRRLPAGRGAPRATRSELLARLPRGAARAGRRGPRAGSSCWEEYRRSCFHGLVMTIAASMVVERTERGDEMFMTWFERNAQQALDLGAVELLPEPRSGRAAGAAPRRRRRGPPRARARGAVERELVLRRGQRRRRARRVRAARPAAQPGRRALHGLRLRPGPPVDDARRRRRAAARRRRRRSRRSQTAGARAPRSSCEQPLRALRGARCAAPPQAYDDQSAPLRGEPGEPVEIALDLVWETDGDPVRLAPVDPLRDPLPRDRHGARRRRADRSSPARASATTRGARATGGRSTGCGARCISTTARHTHAVGAAADARLRRRLRAARARSSRRSRRSHAERSSIPAA